MWGCSLPVFAKISIADRNTASLRFSEPCLYHASIVLWSNLMADIIPLTKTRRKAHRAKTRDGRTLCRHGFHRWEVVPGTPFDVKTGKLVTRYKCTRCGEVRNKGV